MNNTILSPKHIENFVEHSIGRAGVQRINDAGLWPIFDEIEKATLKAYDNYIETKESGGYTFSDIQKQIVDVDFYVTQLFSKLPVGDGKMSDFFSKNDLKNAPYMLYQHLKIAMTFAAFLVDRFLREESKAKVLGNVKG